jgi:deoxyribose-phosphate aldolase
MGMTLYMYSIAQAKMSKLQRKELAQYFDHTLLRANARQSEIEKLCGEATDNSFYSVCVNPKWIPLCSKLLKNSSVLPITVVGFPLGADGTLSKAYTARWAIDQGAREIDMVIDIGACLDSSWNEVSKDISEIANVCEKLPLKVILETSYLNAEQIKMACKVSEEAGAAFVKTSTGFSDGGATIEAVSLMKQCVDNRLGVKASGGIRSLEQCLAFIDAGATRIGSSSGVKILGELK